MAALHILSQTLAPPEQRCLVKDLQALRRGYPELPLAKQSRGERFRRPARAILGKLLQEGASLFPGETPTLVLSWPAGVAFAAEASPELPLCHIHFRRDPESLETLVDLALGELDPNRPVLIADPMLASGNTVVELIQHVLERGIPAKRVVLLCVLAVPVGVKRLASLFPDLRILCVEQDAGLDGQGFIWPGLGDFTEKFFADFSAEEQRFLDARLGLAPDIQALLHSYVHHHPLRLELGRLVVRDHRDAETARHLKEGLEGEGLVAQEPLRRLHVDTGLVEGVENVVDRIVAALDGPPPARLIVIEGLSGVGKSSTTRHLQERIGAASFSLGEVFRYLAFCSLEKGETPERVVSRLLYRFEPSAGLRLYDGEYCVTEQLRTRLREPAIERQVPEVASICQTAVIGLVAKELAQLRDSGDLNQPIILEGRSYTLEFLPADLRVLLTADPIIRAQRRQESP